MKRTLTPLGSDQRRHVALDAAIQVSGLFEVVLCHGIELGASDMIRESAEMRAIGIRGKRLANAMLSMLSDELAPIDEARRLVVDESDAPPEDAIESEGANG